MDNQNLYKISHRDALNDRDFEDVYVKADSDLDAVRQFINNLNLMGYLEAVEQNGVFASYDESVIIHDDLVNVDREQWVTRAAFHYESPSRDFLVYTGDYEPDMSIFVVKEEPKGISPEFISDLKAILKDINSDSSDIIHIVNDFAAHANDASIEMDGVRDTARTADDAIDSAKDYIDEIKESLDNLRNYLGKASSAIYDLINDSVDDLESSVSTMSSDADKVESSFSSILSGIESIGKTISEYLDVEDD